MISVALRAISLCTGYGGIELGLRAALGDGVRIVGSVERQAYAAAVLAARMESHDLDPCPVWDDLESFDGRAWRDRVDLVAAGFPCQGASVAGKRLGVSDHRWLWPHVWRITRECGASLLFIENVPGLLSVNQGQAFREILDDLAQSWWVAEWDCIPAAACGAPHLRDRLFLLAADPNGIGVRKLAERDQRSWGANERPSAGRASLTTMARTGELCELSDEIKRLPNRPGGLPTPTAQDCRASGVAGNWSRESGRNAGATLTDVVVRRLDTSTNQQSEDASSGIGDRRLNPAFVEWMMGLPPEWTSVSTSSETESSRKPQPSPGASSRDESSRQLTMLDRIEP